MDKHDIMNMWVHDDEMNLCEFCTDNCEIGDKCRDFKWNGTIPEGK
ncbi:MAG: hypothetical protein PHH48_06385 [Eubacteriales bacterium]|nr:hypothetical protein [Eubacteriales bacterium]